MAIEAKAVFLRGLEKRMSTTITAELMSKLLSMVSDALECFDIKEINAGEESDDLMECYFDALVVQNRSPKTINHYKEVLRRMSSELKISARKVTVYHLRSYLTKMKECGIKDSTLAHYRSVFSSYFTWLFREGLIDKNPIVNLGTIKVPKVTKQVFTDIDMEKMRQSCTCIRDKAMITFLAATGCRVGELVALNRDQIDFKELECIVHGKGDKERMVYFDNVTAMHLKKYLDQRKDNCEALFVNRYDMRFAENGIRDLCKRIEEASGVSNVHPHKFRRTFATNAAKRGVPIQSVAKLMGHDNIETTMTYIVLNNEDVKLKYRQFCAS